MPDNLKITGMNRDLVLVIITKFLPAKEGESQFAQKMKVKTQFLVKSAKNKSKHYNLKEGAYFRIGAKTSTSIRSFAEF